MTNAPDWIAEYNDYADRHFVARLREAITRGLYPTAWGYQWPPEWWDDVSGKNCLRTWGDEAMKNSMRVLRLSGRA